MAINLRSLLTFFGLGRAEDDGDPSDHPVAFGYKSTWLAVKADTTEAVCAALSLTRQNQATWAGGVAKARGKTWVFVTPPVDGWVLVVTDRSLSSDSDDNVERLSGLLNQLSREFGEAHYFGSYRVVGYVAWFKSVDGQMARAFSYADGTLFANLGATTDAEADLGYPDTTGLDAVTLWDALDETDARMDEEDPMRIAGAWSVNPLELGKTDAGAGKGIVGAMDVAKAVKS